MSTLNVSLSLYPLHLGQQHVIDVAKRFNVLDCGRRWGKTTLCQELAASPEDERNGFLNGFPIGYFAPTYKNLIEVWNEFIVIFGGFVQKKDAENRILYFYGGGRLDFWSLDNPDAIRGRKYKRVIIDEAAAVKKLKNIWTKVLRPMLTDLKGDAWFLSTPQGKLNYFYELFLKELIPGSQWVSHQLPTSNNPHIDVQEIADAEADLDPISFSQEYLASFVNENISQWAYSYDPKKHKGDTVLDRNYEVYLSFDFNRNPITCGVYQHYRGIRGIEQIKLPTSNIYHLCDYIRAKYAGCMFIVTGDATGKAGSALVQDDINYYTIIKKELGLSDGQLKVPSVNPVIKENRVLVNSILHNQDIIFDKTNCKGILFDLEHARVLPDGELDKTDRKDPTKQLDALDCLRYYLNIFHRHLIRYK